MRDRRIELAKNAAKLLAQLPGSGGRFFEKVHAHDPEVLLVLSMRMCLPVWEVNASDHVSAMPAESSTSTQMVAEAESALGRRAGGVDKAERVGERGRHLAASAGGLSAGIPT